MFLYEMLVGHVGASSFSQMSRDALMMFSKHALADATDQEYICSRCSTVDKFIHASLEQKLQRLPDKNATDLVARVSAISRVHPHSAYLTAVS